MNSWSTKIAVLGLMAALLTGLLLRSQWNREPLKVSGFIEADEIRLGSRVGGRVREVHIEEGEEITVGQLLVELEPFDFNQRRAEAESRHAAQKARYEQLQKGFREEEIFAAEARFHQMESEYRKAEKGPRQQEIDAAQAELDAASATFGLEQNEFQIAKSLFDKKVLTRDEIERARKELDAAAAQVQVREEQLALLKIGTRQEDKDIARARMEEAEQEWILRKNGYRQEEIDQAYAGMQAAKSAVDVIEQQIAELEVKSPVSGTVQAIDLQPGDLVNANAPVLSLLDTSHLWVRAYVPEDELDLSVGQKLKITVDSFPGEAFSGEITFVARQAEFTPRNVQTPEERSKQVFRIKVTLLDGLDRLRPGMGADVWLKP